MANHGYLSLTDIGYGEATGFKGINCRHDWCPYYEGSARTYTDKELKRLANETVTYNGKQLSKYEVQQTQRKMERLIRQDKKNIAGLQGSLLSNNKELDIKKVKKDLEQAKLTLKIHNTTLNEFLKQTELRKDYSRLKVAIKNNFVKSKETQKAAYKNVTSNFIKPKKYNVKEQQYYIDDKGKKYKVDGKNVVLKPTVREKEVANILGQIHGGQVNIIPRVNEPSNIKTPDYIINNKKFDLKEITGNGKWTIEGNLKGKKEQANNFIIDLTNSKMEIKEAERQIESIYSSKHYLWIDEIILIKENSIIKIFKRK